jgi:prepilin-type N-terminal cleavage/methylation domain-containing protein
MKRSEQGFSLVELLVVVLIVGILAAFSIPKYNHTVETSRAENAAATLIMIGQANRMFQLDLGQYANNGTLSDTCNSASCCSGSCSASQRRDRCQLIACKYLASQPWSNGNYYFQAGTNVSCGVSASCSGSSRIACARRQGAASASYNSWGYIYCSDGSLKWDNTKGTPEIKL